MIMTKLQQLDAAVTVILNGEPARDPAAAARVAEQHNIDPQILLDYITIKRRVAHVKEAHHAAIDLE